MRRILCALTVLAVTAGPASAQFLLGLTSVDTDPGAGTTLRFQVVTIPAGTGAVSLLTGSPTDAAVFNGHTANDPAGNRYFFLGTPDGGAISLYVVNTGNGSFESGALSGVTFNAFLDIEYDAGEGVLYGLVNASGNIRLVTIDHTSPGMGTMALSAGNAGALGFTGGTADLDPTANFYYFRDGVAGTLVAVNTGTGNVADSGASPSILGLEGDPDSFEAFALQSTGDPTFDLRIVELSTADATFGTEIGTGAGLTGGMASTAGAETSNPAGNIFYFIATPSGAGPTLYAVNTTTLALADSDLLTGGVDESPDGLEFDPDTLPVELQSFDVE
jgi:hypothetical protein